MPEPKKNRYVALLLGINIGPHKKVPMVELKKLLTNLGYLNITTLLNTGNAIFDSDCAPLKIKEEIKCKIQKTFGFEVKAIVIPKSKIEKMVAKNPFKNIGVTKNIRLYVTFIDTSADTKSVPLEKIKYPYNVESKGSKFTILHEDKDYLFSVLDVGEAKTTDAMDMLKKRYAHYPITTRNWNTVLKISES